jgi:hypothetical protein
LGIAAEILARQIGQRCGARVVTSGEAPLSIELAIRPDLPREGFRIESGGEGEVRILGGDERGVLYGVGKFLRTSRYDRGGFSPSEWRGSSAPKCPFRAVYLATHFNNFYEAAPLEEVVRYIQDLALWGTNTIVIHFPAWQFDGIADPAARMWLERFTAVLREVRKCGLRVGLIEAPNEGYKTVPSELRKTEVPGHRRGNFGSGLCVSKPAAASLLAQTYDELLKEFQGVGLDYFVFWPYDEGGCACKDCWPWGARGFLRTSRALADRVRARFPECKLVLSTWCFENEDDANPDGEWAGLAKAMAKDGDWLTYLMADGHDDYFPRYLLETGVPGNLPLLNFPEISMFGMAPWGGYGANPAPAHFEMLWRRIKHIAAGGAPYSEGIYEDLNKAIIAGFYWDPGRPAEETVKEYIAFEFSPDAVADLTEAVGILERNHDRGGIGADARRALELVGRAESAMTQQARVSWRWRIFFLRALIDKEMFERNGKLEGESLKKAFEELTRIYHAEATRVAMVRPPQMA